MYRVRFIVAKFPAGGPYKIKDVDRPDIPHQREDKVICNGYEGRVVDRQLPANESLVAAIFIDLTHRSDYEKLEWEEVSSP